MKLYRRKNKQGIETGPYQFKFMLNGELVRKSTGTTNEREADRIANAMRTDALRNGVGILKKKDVPTVKEFQKKFTEHVAAEVAPTTLEFYTDCYNRLLADGSPLANVELDAVNFEKLAAFQRFGQKHWPSNTTINHSLRTLRRALRLAVRLDIIPKAPQFSKKSGTMLKEQGRDFVLSHEAEHTYLEVAPDFLKAAAMLDVETGCRISELIGLKWSDVNWHARTLHIRGTKTKNSDREVNLTSRALNVMEEQKQVSKCDYILTSPRWADRQASKNGLEHAHEAAREKAGLPDGFVFHSFRHTFCTRFADATGDAVRLMKLAGHANLATSQKYIHASAISTENAMQAFEKHAEEHRKSALGTKLGTVRRKVQNIR